MLTPSLRNRRLDLELTGYVAKSTTSCITKCFYLLGEQNLPYVKDHRRCHTIQIMQNGFFLTPSVVPANSSVPTISNLKNVQYIFQTAISFDKVEF